jgi:hypothetical protein
MRMWQRLSTKQRLACVSIVVITALLYLGACFFAIGAAWQRNEGDVPPISPWLEHATYAFVIFPFGYVPGLQSIVLAPIFNALLWGLVAGLIFIRVSKKPAS